jgi:hypothetical protein
MGAIGRLAGGIRREGPAMRRKRFTEEQIIGTLKEAAVGARRPTSAGGMGSAS